ncbi:MAG: hypothetical protein AB8B77_05535 [Alphaproteobacteria bacterium]
MYENAFRNIDYCVRVTANDGAQGDIAKNIQKTFTDFQKQLYSRAA